MNINRKTIDNLRAALSRYEAMNKVTAEFPRVSTNCSNCAISCSSTCFATCAGGCKNGCSGHSWA